MGWKPGLLFTLLVLITNARKLKDIEPSPLHKRNAQNVKLDVRDSYVRIKKVTNHFDPAVAVSVNVTEINNADPVRISWSNAAAGAFDMIAIYTPPSRDPKDYLDFRYVSDTTGWEGGTGYFDEVLFNMRGDYLIRYLAVDKENATTVKATYTLHVIPNEPMQGHIAVTGVPGEMRIMWNSDSAADSPRVNFGISRYLVVEAVPAETTTYTAEDLCGPRANVSHSLMYIPPGYFHNAVLKELKPGVRYYYNYGTNKRFSETLSFVAAPYPDTKVALTTFIGYGDMGVYYPPYYGNEEGSGPVVKLLNEEAAKGDTDFIVHFGDISYARGRGYLWDQFMTHMANVSSRLPYMVGVGNHEYDHVSGGAKDPSGAPGEGFHPEWGNFGDDGGGECGVPTMHRYISPNNGNLVFWYSFDYGLVHVVQFSSEHDYRPGTRQYKWLENDLKTVNRKRTPWVVVTSHRAMYTSQMAPGDHKNGLHMLLCLEELFYRYRVNLHLSGHAHSYESTCPVVSGDCVSPAHGTVYIVVGTAGKDLEPLHYWYYPWSKHRQTDRYGYQRMTANTTHMHVEFVTAPHGEVTDDITIPIWEENNTEYLFKKRSL